MAISRLGKRVGEEVEREKGTYSCEYGHELGPARGVADGHMLSCSLHIVLDECDVADDALGGKLG